MAIACSLVTFNVCFSMAIKVKRTRLSVTLNVHCLSCYYPLNATPMLNNRNTLTSLPHCDVVQRPTLADIWATGNQAAIPAR